MKTVGTGVHLSAFLRSFAIQGSWNYRTMMGSGFAFAILPVLRKLYGGSQEELDDALRRHAEHFNAHPYLAALAVGTACRMEEDGRDPEDIRRFKMAIRGPLGSLGDSLVWVGWRPATLLAAIVLALMGASPAVTVVFFLLTYNLGHLALRIWGFRVGLEMGSQVGDALRFFSLPLQADRMARTAVLFLGGTTGLVLNRGLEHGMGGLVWILLAGVGMWLGSLAGQKAWRWTLWGMSGVIGSFLIFGWFG